MISDLKNIPRDWEKIKFGDIAINITDRIDNPKDSGLDNYIGLEHLDTNEIRIKRYGSPDEVKATKFLCKKGDIIFGKRRAYLRKLAVTDRDAVVSAHSMVLRANKDKVLSDFLPWFMQSTQFWKTAYAISEGSLSPTIKWKTLAIQEFWLPNQVEQKKIAKLLWGIENHIEKTEIFIQGFETLKHALHIELFTKGLNHSKFKSTKIGDIPEEWNSIILGNKHFFELKTGGTPSTKTAEYWTGGIPWLTSGELHRKRITYTEKEISKEGFDNSNATVIPINTTLIALAGQGKTRGTVAITKTELTTNQSIAAVIPQPEKYNPLFLYHYLNNQYEYLRRISGGTGRAGLSLRILSNVEVPLPTLGEQSKISRILENADNTLSKFNEHSSALKNLKNKLVDSLLSGKKQIKENLKNDVY
jgi:type I restriction enzyme, S subunit